MRYLVLSDVHGNLEALEGVLEAIPPARYDRVLVLGDLVGYGGNPNEVVACVRALEPVAIIRGNHDKVASGLEDGESFNAVARSAVEWTL
ncbi:MAG TPA: metallophosphoesterase family protein, partial [Methylomirabilota bacterium]